MGARRVDELRRTGRAMGPFDERPVIVTLGRLPAEVVVSEGRGLTVEVGLPYEARSVVEEGAALSECERYTFEPHPREVAVTRGVAFTVGDGRDRIRVPLV